MPTTLKNDPELDLRCINTIRTLSIDAVQAANSGHPGTPMALAPVAYCLWQRFLSFDPSDPIWPNRDRFVLSAGHASMLLYSLLHLSEVKSVSKNYETLGEPSVPLEAIKKFRQLDSRCPGHPEYRWTSGVETTTGPLGQGIANSVGMAMGSKWMAARFNKPGFTLFDFNVYAICSDGDIMEGVSSESASIAGHLKLDNLCWIYDNNHISIEGSTNLAFTDDVGKRFEGHGWNVVHVTNANDLDMLTKAYEAFLAQKEKPTMIIVNSHIGYGTSKQDTKEAHGEPLGEKVIEEFKKKFNLPPEKFFVPDGVYDRFRAGIGQRGKELRDEWFSLIAKFKTEHPKDAEELRRMQHRELPEGWDKDLPTFSADAKGMASRVSSSKVLNAVAKNVPWLIGGSADLAPSTRTMIEGPDGGNFQNPAFDGTYAGRNLHFGVRELAMGAIINGLALTKIRPYGSTFFIFSDFCRPAIRLAAIMEIPAIYIFTHDSIGVGEDGPTHQPVEQLPAIRAIPGLVEVRPADANEVVEAWRLIMQLKHEPSALILTRQDLPTMDRTKYASAAGLAKGAYIMADAPNGKPDVILMASGSEVSLCINAYETLKAEGINARVVSMPSWHVFEKQSEEYQESVIPKGVIARVSVEQASTFGWERYTGLTGARIGMHTFGASAPLKELQKKFGFSPEHVVKAAREQVELVKKLG